MSRLVGRVIVAVSMTAGSMAAWGKVTFLEPTPYLSVVDSPFDMSGLGSTFFFEDFEDGEFDLPPGVTVYPGIIKGPGPLTDSVDADDGIINGSGNGGHSLMPTFTSVGPSNPPVWWTTMGLSFDEQQLGFLPNSVGLVWSDGMSSSRLSLTVREGGGILSSIVFSGLMDQSYAGETLEDRFIGVTSDRGINHWGVTHSYRGDTFTNHFEIDHVQYGLLVPEPAVCALLGLSYLIFRGWTRICGSIVRKGVICNDVAISPQPFSR